MSSKANWRKTDGRPWDIYSITNLVNHKVYISQTKQRMRKSHAGQRHYWQEKPVIRTDTGEMFGSIKEAAEAKGVNSSKIGEVCRGARKNTGGKHWRYA